MISQGRDRHEPGHFVVEEIPARRNDGTCIWPRAKIGKRVSTKELFVGKKPTLNAIALNYNLQLSLTRFGSINMGFAYFCGWAYAIFWGISFYPTLYLNYTLKTADSISLDYIVLNILGYFCYCISVYLQIYNVKVRLQYQQLFDGRFPLLSNADLFYSFHGLALLLILASQIFLGNKIWKFKNERKSFRIHALSKLILSMFLVFAIFSWKFDDPAFALLNFAMNLAYFKIIISLIKYIPQVLHNYRRKSMYGISRLQIIFDLTGSFFSFAEFYLKKNRPILEAVDANRGKVGITIVTFLFGTIFLFQMYLYGTSRSELRSKEKEYDLA